MNANDVPWDTTKRAVSFWYKREFLNCRVLLTSSLGEHYIDYKFTTGTHSVDGSGNVTFYLGSMPTTEWARFERNIEEDFEAVSSGTWTNTDGLSIKIPGTYGTGDTWLDDIRLSNSLTSEHNTIGPGAIAHILRHRKINPTTHAVTDRWFHYDQVGSVMNESNAAGTLETTHHQDAFGNVQSAWDSGFWDGAAEGWGFNTKESLSSSPIMLFSQRWYSAELGSFVSRDLIQQKAIILPYSWGPSNSVSSADPSGLAAVDLESWNDSISKCQASQSKSCKTQNSNCCDFVQCVLDDYYHTKGGSGTKNGFPTYEGGSGPYTPGSVIANSHEFGTKCMGSASQSSTGGGHIGVTDSKGNVCECSGIAGPEKPTYNTRCGGDALGIGFNRAKSRKWRLCVLNA